MLCLEEMEQDRWEQVLELVEEWVVPAWAKVRVVAGWAALVLAQAATVFARVAEKRFRIGRACLVRR